MRTVRCPARIGVQATVVRQGFAQPVFRRERRAVAEVVFDPAVGGDARARKRSVGGN